jgi:hypothetical protein
MTIVRELVVYAQDFLSCHHVNTEDETAIRIHLIDMTRKECTISCKTKDGSSSKKTSKRRGVYLDVLTWKLIQKLINTLFSECKMQMSKIIACAMISHASETVRETIIGRQRDLKLSSPILLFVFLVSPSHLSIFRISEMITHHSHLLTALR